MRFTPLAIGLSMLAVVTASAGLGADRQPDPGATALVEQGRTQLQAGDVEGAIDAFEAALTIDPAYSAVYIDLGDAVRQQGLQGKAIHYYREALAHDPENLAAIAGEGEALAEKGAMDNARENLAQLQSLCGDSCGAARALSAAIERGPLPRVVTAEAVTPGAGVTQN